jgi:hypothetical protein
MKIDESILMRELQDLHRGAGFPKHKKFKGVIRNQITFLRRTLRNSSLERDRLIKFGLSNKKANNEVLGSAHSMALNMGSIRHRIAFLTTVLKSRTKLAMALRSK